MTMTRSNVVALPRKRRYHVAPDGSIWDGDVPVDQDNICQLLNDIDDVMRPLKEAGLFDD